MAVDRDEIAAYKTVLCDLSSIDDSHEYFYVSSDGMCSILVFIVVQFIENQSKHNHIEN